MDPDEPEPEPAKSLAVALLLRGSLCSTNQQSTDCHFSFPIKIVKRDAKVDESGQWIHEFIEVWLLQRGTSCG